MKEVFCELNKRRMKVIITYVTMHAQNAVIFKVLKELAVGTKEEWCKIG